MTNIVIENVKRIIIARSPQIGQYILIELDVDASKAHNTWEKLIEMLHGHVNIKIFVFWTGKLDVHASELGKRLGKIFAELGVSLFTTEHPVNLLEELDDD
ncbi:MAG: hypothetical protein QXJ23_09930 [Thermofilum sp.]|uniref:hypothetical protein n=1 Tax=Thermofilum sp. TaxID=1961369 RepID=UPI00317C3CB9